MATGRSITVTGKAQVEIRNCESGVPDENQVLLKADKTLISPGTERADLLQLPNTHAKHKIPFVGGYCFTGTVEETGKSVQNLKKGDRVYAHLGHKEYHIANQNEIFVVPDEIPSEKAVFTSLGFIAMQGVRKSRIELGTSVLVMGLGLVGQLACKLARINGAIPLAGADISHFRREAASAACDAVLNPCNPDFQKQLMDITGGEGPEVVIEATGIPDVIKTAYSLVARMGKLILLGSTRGETDGVNFYYPIHKKGISIIGAHMTAVPESEKQPYLWPRNLEFKLFLELLAEKRLDVSDLITDRYNVSNAPEAYNKLAEWNEKIMAIIIDWNE